MIQIQTFGSFSILVNGKVAHQRLGIPGCDLAALLMMNPNKRFRREKLVEMFWGHLEENKARHCMNTALWRLRTILGINSRSDSRMAINSEAGQIALQPSKSLMVDARELSQCVRSIWNNRDHDHDPVSFADQQSLLQALELYQGPFLEHSDADWVIEAREYLQTLYVRGLRLLLTAYAQDARYEHALDCARLTLSVDPLRESVQRDTMRLFVLNGQRAEAIRQYQRCRRMLKEDFGVDPMPDTVNVYQEIISGDIFSDLDGVRLKVGAQG